MTPDERPPKSYLGRVSAGLVWFVLLMVWLWLALQALGFSGVPD